MKKGEKLQYFANFFCSVVLFDIFYCIVIIMFGWYLCSKLNFIAIFLVLANFAAFLDHTKENAGVSRNDG